MCQCGLQPKIIPFPFVLRFLFHFLQSSKEKNRDRIYVKGEANQLFNV